MSFCAAETVSGSSAGRPGIRPRFLAEGTDPIGAEIHGKDSALADSLLKTPSVRKRCNHFSPAAANIRLDLTVSRSSKWADSADDVEHELAGVSRALRVIERTGNWR